MSINQLEIWEIDFAPNIGTEIGKKRPAIVVSSDLIGKLPLKTVVPITGYAKSYEHYPWMVKIVPDALNGLSKESAVDCFQIRNFSTKRFVKKLGKVDTKLFGTIQKTIIKTLEISE
jgi:mRNA interferase MazF